MSVRMVHPFNGLAVATLIVFAFSLTSCSLTYEVKEDFTITMPTGSGSADSILDSKLKSAADKVEKYPQRDDLHFEISMLHFQKEDYRRAEDSLYSALSVKPNDVRYLFQLGRVQFIMKEFYEAEESFEKAIAATGKSARYDGLHLTLGYTRCNLKKWEDARENFLTCTEITPLNPLPYYFLGAIADIRNDSDAAVKYMRQYLDHGGGAYSGQARKVLQFNGVVDVPARKGKATPSSLDGGYEQKPNRVLPGDLEIKPASSDG